jgi:hypothetical protein
MSTLKISGIIVVAVIVLTALIAGHSSGSTSSSAGSSSAASTPEPKPHIRMLRGASSTYCLEADSVARIYVSIALRNSGNATGTVEPWATFDYSDGGHSEETYTSNYGHSFTVPAHTTLIARFYHTFNPQQHYMIRCAGSRDLYGNAPSYYLPIEQ